MCKMATSRYMLQGVHTLRSSEHMHVFLDIQGMLALHKFK